MKTLLIIASAFVACMSGAQTTSTAGGLNQNDVNVIRDGDFPESNSGIIKMTPSGKKGKVMKMVPDSSAAGTPSLSPPTVSTVATDSSIRFKDQPKTGGAKKGIKKKRPSVKSRGPLIEPFEPFD